MSSIAALGEQLLVDAACDNDVERVHGLLAAGDVDVNYADQANGSTALIQASKNGHAEIVRVLLAVSGINANHANTQGTTALSYASQNGHAEIVRALLAVDGTGVDANHATNQGATALSYASQNGHAEVVRALLAVNGTGVDVNHATDQGATALTYASQAGHAEIVRALLAVEGINANHATNQGATALIYASQNGHAEVVRALLAVEGIDANHATTGDGSTALIYASQEGHNEIARALLAVDGINANHATNAGGTALTVAIFNHHTGCIRALAAAKGININLPRQECGNRSALHDACAFGGTEIVELLLVAGGCRFLSDDNGNKPLNYGARKAFASGVDYWQRKRHGGHTWSTRQVVTTLLCVRQRLFAEDSDGDTDRRKVEDLDALPHLPEEIWLAMCAFLRSADFAPCRPDNSTQRPLSTPGTQVVITGLTASPHFNGRVGVVQGPATTPGRLAVLLDGDAKPKSLRQKNLRKTTRAFGRVWMAGEGGSTGT